MIWWGWGFKFCKHISGKHQIGLYKTKHVAFEQDFFRHTKSTHPTPLLLGPGAPGASTSLSLIIKFEISIWIPKFQYHRKWYLWNQLKPSEINWNHRSANFSTKRKKSQNLNVPKTQDTTKSKTKLKVSSKMIPKISLYKIKNLLGNDSRYQTISHKKCFVPKVSVSDFVAFFFWRYGFLLFYIPIKSLPIYWRSTAESRAQKKTPQAISGSCTQQRPPAGSTDMRRPK